MKCPACPSELIVIELDQVEVDHCVSCKGIWLDALELELLFGDFNHQGKWLESFKPVFFTNEIKRKCPLCDDKMDKVNFAADGNVIFLDQCRKKHGVWCDHGELQRILAAKNSKTGSQVLKLLQDIFTN